MSNQAYSGEHPSEREQRLAATVARIENQFGRGSIQRLGAGAAAEVQVIPTGLDECDRVIGVGGLPRGRIVEMLGPESSGVSTLLLHALGAAQSRGGLVALVDADLAFDPEYARRIGLDLDSLFIARPDDGAMALEIVDALVRSGAFDLVVVDSVPALEPPQERNAEVRTSRAARQGRLLSEALRRLAAGIDRTRTVVVFGNRTTAPSADSFPAEAPGGRALRFYASVRVELRRGELIREPIGVVGRHVELIAVKNKLAPPLRTGMLRLVFGEGFQ